jgi:hypothetical protein
MRSMVLGVVGALALTVSAHQVALAQTAGAYDHIDWDSCYAGPPGEAARCISLGHLHSIEMRCHTPFDCRLYIVYVMF